MLLSNAIYSKVSFMGLRGGHPLPLQTYIIIYIQYIRIFRGLNRTQVCIASHSHLAISYRPRYPNLNYPFEIHHLNPL